MTVRNFVAATAAAALFALGAAAGAQETRPDAKPAAPAGPPMPAPEIKSLAFFDGNWTCEGVVPPNPFGPNGKLRSTVRTESTMNGFWHSGTITGSMEGFPGAFEGRFNMTYDPGAKNYVMFWADNMGGWSVTTSSGWEGDQIVFAGEGHMGTMKMMGRDIFTKNADGSLKHTWAVQADGKWTEAGSETCRKGS